MTAQDGQPGMRLHTPCWGNCMIKSTELVGRQLRIVVFDPVVAAWTHMLELRPTRVVQVGR